MSLDDYRIIKANLIDGGDHSTGDRLVPSCLFIDPELAHVGLTETEAQQQDYLSQFPRNFSLSIYFINQRQINAKIRTNPFLARYRYLTTMRFNAFFDNR